MKSLFTELNHQVATASSLPELASRRNWMKGFGALLGSSLLAGAPAAALANPSAATSPPLPASAAVGGDEYIGMVKILSGPTLPQGWALCDGRLLEAGQHPALFAVMGAVYGGDGQTTFALPKLSAALPLAEGSGSAPAVCAHSLPEPSQRVPAVGIFAIKIANAPATAGTIADLRLKHHCRPRAGRAA